MSGQGRKQLRGRRREFNALEELASKVEAGQSSALVLRGEAGIGKSALLDHLAGYVAGYRVARSAGAESEMELPFAALHQLCAPFLGHSASLPLPQREALTTAFGVSTGPPPDRFLVGLAVLGLLTEVAAEKPLFCLVDDAQWVDRVSAQTLAFVTRRMLAEPLALVFATRELKARDEFAGLPELTIDGLDNGDALALLASEAGGPLDERVRDRILAEARGNPLALLELPHSREETEPLGFGLPDPGPVTGRIERSYVERVRSLPPATQRLLLAAAAEPIGDVTLLRRAAALLDIDPEAAGPAVAAGLFDIDALVRFKHPLLRSAIYRSAELAELREIHRVLAEVTDPGHDPDRRAWHLARSTVRPDEAIATELESSAVRAQARGGTAAAAAFLAHAAVLTPQPQRKATRALAAAQAKLRAGAPAAARDLLSLAESGVLDEIGHARVHLTHAQIAFADSRGAEALPLLLAAAQRLVPLDVGLARETFLDTVSAAMFAGRLAVGATVREVAEAAHRTSPSRTRLSRNADLLMDALATRFTSGYRAAVAGVRDAVSALRRETDPEQVLRWSWLASALAAEMWDDEGWTELAMRHVQTTRSVGALTELPLALHSRVVVHTFAGELDAAALLVAESLSVQQAAGSNSFTPYGTLTLAAWRGRESEAARLVRTSLHDATNRGEGAGVSVAHRAGAVLYNGLGRYEEAFDSARQASAHPQDLAVYHWGLTELVEAAVRSGHREAAEAALAELTRATEAAATDWALGVQARSQALLGQEDSAEELYREAVERLGRTRVKTDLARAHLLYGEWLRRQNRRVDAREQLRVAHTLFSQFGAGAFAERSVRELRAAGETVTRRTGAAAATLTPQETQIAQLARAGLTNTEIGAQLFLSPHTVEWHLRKVYAKLNITSRRLLHTAL
ncbi:LuxR family transcriptional regulator [Streptomyces canus]|uniref:LuxR family transcriptional regulator n=1 Tax=Streptomyces canus TaxID=58343 RepID=A0A101SI30_9ACTN|nr:MULTISPECIES: LuxR family transcriptional regulator [Streptomyces]KUN74197.1 LuxR family transcriptional regulator [Streptomyces canus]MDI5910766.1 AAA family ATPase [Streptomyces sp. 12257]